MKNLMVIVLLLATVCTGWAKPTAPQKTTPLAVKLQRALQTKPLTWQEQLRHLQTQFAQVGNKSFATDAPAVFKTNLNPSQNKRYTQRLFELQEKINSNPDLKGYRFAAPLPEDLANLSGDNYEALYAFVQGFPTARVMRTQWVHPFTLALRIQGLQTGAVELWIDEPTQSIYLMSDNLFTTASGKYAHKQLEK